MANHFKMLGLEHEATASEVQARCDRLLKELNAAYITTGDPATLKRIKQIGAAREDMADLDVYKAALGKRGEWKKAIAESLGILVGAIFVVPVLLWGMFSCSNSLTTPAKMDEFGAHVACQEFVRRGLKAPSTADFAGYGDSVVSGGGGFFVVRSYVDAQNGFGAKIRTDWVCNVESRGKSWHLNDLSTNSR